MTGGGQGGAGRSVDSKIYLRCSGERRWLVPLGAMKLLQVHGRYLVDSRYLHQPALVPATGGYVTRHGVLKTPYIPHFQYIRKLCIDFSTRVSSLINYLPIALLLAVVTVHSAAGPGSRCCFSRPVRGRGCGQSRRTQAGPDQ